MSFSHKFDKDLLIEKIKTVDIQKEALISLETADFLGVIQTGIRYAHRVIKAEALQDKCFRGLLDEQDFTCIENNEAGLEAYYNLYAKLAEAR